MQALQSYQVADGGLCIAIQGRNGVCISLCICRCILHALKVLHQAGYGHTDLRWENIILQHADQWVLIDLEFACVLNSVPFTPVGEPMSCIFVCGLYCLSAGLTYSDNLKAYSPRCLFNQLCPSHYYKTSLFPVLR